MRHFQGVMAKGSRIESKNDGANTKINRNTRLRVGSGITEKGSLSTCGQCIQCIHLLEGNMSEPATVKEQCPFLQTLLTLPLNCYGPLHLKKAIRIWNLVGGTRKVGHQEEEAKEFKQQQCRFGRAEECVFSNVCVCKSFSVCKPLCKSTYA